MRAKHATLGSYTHQPGNSVGVAISRRRYSQLEFITINKQKTLAAVTPSANRNTYSVAIIFSHCVPRVEALRTSTLGYEIATPTELRGCVPMVQYNLLIVKQVVYVYCECYIILYKCPKGYL